MSLTVTHSFVSGIADSSAAAAAGKVLPQSQWNAPHAVSGNLPVSQLDGGAGAGPTTFWRGDGTWALTPVSSSSGLPVSTALSIVNVKDFGAIGDNTTDDTDAIQAAIDYSYVHNIRTVYMPDGNYRTTKPLFLDPPNNLRGSYSTWLSSVSYSSGNRVTYNGMPWESITSSNVGNTPVLNGANFTATGDWSSANHDNTGKFVFWNPTVATPSMFAQNMSLTGPPGQARGDAPSGAKINCNFNNAVGLWVGSGNGMYVGHIAINGGVQHSDATDGGTTPTTYSNAYRWSQGMPSMGIGFAIAGTGGATRCFIEWCTAGGFYTGIKTGAVADGLGDFNIISNNFIWNTSIGVWVSQTQNFIDVFRDNLIAAHMCVYTVVGCGAEISGGNYSTMNEQAPGCKWTVGSVTRLSDTTLSAVLSAPNPASFNGITMVDYVTTGQLTRFVARTTNFGLVPLIPTTYAVGTSTMVFTIDPDWINAYGPDLSATYDLTAEITALTEFYAAECVVTFYGVGIHAEKVLIENICATQFVNNQFGFGFPVPSSYRDIHFDAVHGWSGTAFDDFTDTSLAANFVQSVVPFIIPGASLVEIASCGIPTTNFCAPLLMGAGFPPTIKNCHGFNFNYQSGGGIVYFQGINTGMTGTGRTDVLQTAPLGTFAGVSVMDSNHSWRLTGMGQHEAWGTMPAMDCTPILLPDHMTVLTGTLPALTKDVVPNYNWNMGYPLLWGGLPYKIVNPINSPFYASPTHNMVISNHHYYTYGQTIPVGWSCKGQSHVVNVDDVTPFFPGLGIVITTDVSARYVITGVYALDLVGPGQSNPAVAPGYLFVHGDFPNPGPQLISGVKTTTYTSSSVQQDPFSFTYIDTTDIPQAPVTVANLPSAATHTGVRKMVTDATVTTFMSSAVGGGGNIVPVISDGTIWRIG